MMPDAAQVLHEVTLEVTECLKKIEPTTLAQAATIIAETETIFLAGAGRSRLSISGFAMRLMHLGKKAWLIGEVSTPAIKEGDLLVIGSGAGETNGLILMAQKAKRIGAKILLITREVDSTIGQMADLEARIPALSLKAFNSDGAHSVVQPGGSLFEQCLLILSDMLILIIMRTNPEKYDLRKEGVFLLHANLE